MLMKKVSILFIFQFLILYGITGVAQNHWGKGQFSGNFGFNGMYYIPDTLIHARAVKEKVRGNAWLSLNYVNNGLSIGLCYEFYSFPLIDFEDINYKGQGLTRYYVDYQNNFIQVTAGTFYDQFGQGLSLRAYEERQLGIDNSLLGARVKVMPYKGIILKGVWGLLRKNFDFDYKNRHDYVRGLDGEINFGTLIPKIAEKGFSLSVGGSFVSKYEKSTDDIAVNYYHDGRWNAGSIPANKIPENVGLWAARMEFGYKGFHLESEFAHKINDPNITNQYIYKDGNSFIINAAYSQKGLGVQAAFIRADNMDFRSQRSQLSTTPLLSINYIPAINHPYTFALLSNYQYSVQNNGQIGVEAEVHYQIPKTTVLGGKYGTNLSFYFSRFHDIEHKSVALAKEIQTETGTQGYTSHFFKFGKHLLYQDIGININHRFNAKQWKLEVAYNYITYNMEILRGHLGPLFHGHNVMGQVDYQISKKHALKLEIEHLYAKEDDGNWVSGLLEYTFAPNWFISIADQWNYGNKVRTQRIHYYTLSAAYVIKTTRIALTFGKTREGILCVGGVCRSVPASYGLGLSVTTSF